MDCVSAMLLNPNETFVNGDERVPLKELVGKNIIYR